MEIEYLPPVTPGLPDRRGPARPAFPVPNRLPIAPPGQPPRVQPGAPVIEIERSSDVTRRPR